MTREGSDQELWTVLLSASLLRTPEEITGPLQSVFHLSGPQIKTETGAGARKINLSHTNSMELLAVSFCWRSSLEAQLVSIHHVWKPNMVQPAGALIYLSLLLAFTSGMIYKTAYSAG
jgi:hypothetical protein